MNDFHTIKEYYEREYIKHREKTFPFDHMRYDQWLTHVLDKAQDSKKVLDIGCGVGYLCAHLHQQGHDVFGVDISEEAIAIARKQIPSGTFSVTNESSQFNFDNQMFDVITCIGVLEHIPHPEKILKESNRVLKKGGKVIFLVPNKFSPYFWFGGTGQIYEQPRSYKGWYHMFESSGFTVLSVQRDPGPTLQSNEKCSKKIKILLLKILNGLPIQCAYQFNFLLEK